MLPIRWGVRCPVPVVATFRLPVDEPTMKEKARGDWAFSDAMYFHPVFREHYLPNPVEVDTWRTMFVFDDSPEINRMGSWRGIGR